MTAEPDWIQDVDTVVWRIEALDPDETRDSSGIGADHERQAIYDHAATLGLLMTALVAEDEYPDGMPYVAWELEVPAAVHVARGARGWPTRIERLLEDLRARYSGLRDWNARVDVTLTWDLVCQGEIRQEYADLIEAIEVALLPLRTREAATRVDAMVHAWGVDRDMMIGTYCVPVARRADGAWLLVEVGIVAPHVVAGDSVAATRARRFGIDAEQPVLVVPRPPDLVFFAQISPDHRHGVDDLMQGRTTQDLPLAVIRDFRWIARTPQDLAKAVVDSRPAWWPAGQHPDSAADPSLD